VLTNFTWNRISETNAEFVVIEDRLPAIFDFARLFFPKYEALADPE
jgi:hypothetical protein